MAPWILSFGAAAAALHCGRLEDCLFDRRAGKVCALKVCIAQYRAGQIGIAQVRETFKVPKLGTIAGCMVTDGRITRQGDAQARLLRDNVVVWEGKLGSLKRFKDDAAEVKAGFECGIGLHNFNDVKVGDVIEVFQMERVAQPA